MLLESLDTNKLKEILQVFFCNVLKEKEMDNVAEETYALLIEDEKYYLTHNVSLEKPSAGLYALSFYRLLKTSITRIKNPRDKMMIEDKITRYMLKEFSCYISPNATLNIGVVLLGVNIFIEKNVLVMTDCIINSNVIIGVNDTNSVNKHISIGKNAIIKNNVVICNNINIGRNVLIKENVVLRENVADNSVVEIINQLQIKSEVVSKLPSQSTVVYGLTPKFKNTLILHGESIYNPKIIIRNSKQKEISHEITYWDKNKIIIKLKYIKFNESDVKGSVLVLMSNGNKVTLVNNFALERALLRLSE